MESPEQEDGSESRSSSPSAGLDRGLKHEQRSESAIPFSGSSGLETPLEAPQPKSLPFLFINTTKKSAGGKQNVESRMLVRSHVMSTFYRKKSSPQIQDGRAQRGVDSGGQTSKFKLESYPQRRKGRRKEKAGKSPRTFKRESADMAISIAPRRLGSGPIDPFEAAVLPWDSRIQCLVKHCMSQLPPQD
jgi:hypothetical protein